MKNMEKVNKLLDAINNGIKRDYVEFLNNKYCDKNINEEWPKPNNKKRIQYHSEQLKKRHK